jgi:uncharacterized membrane protein YkvA (DUF1232 family)
VDEDDRRNLGRGLVDASSGQTDVLPVRTEELDRPEGTTTMKTRAYRTRLFALGRALTAAFRPGAGGLRVQLAATWRMLRAATAGRYPGLSRGTLALLALAALYVVSPIDFVPEALLSVLGVLDDAAVAVWLAGTLAWETERFRAWEAVPPAPGGPTGARVVPGDVVRPDPR